MSGLDPKQLDERDAALTRWVELRVQQDQAESQAGRVGSRLDRAGNHPARNAELRKRQAGLRSASERAKRAAGEQRAKVDKAQQRIDASIERQTNAVADPKARRSLEAQLRKQDSDREAAAMTKGLGLSQSDSRVRAGSRTGNEFLRKNDVELDRRLEWYRGTDFHSPVRVRTLDAGQQLQARAWQPPGKGPQAARAGSWVSPPGQSSDQTGLGPSGRAHGTDQVPRTLLRGRTTDRTQVLESRAAPIIDSWSQQGRGHETRGGGMQWYAPPNQQKAMQWSSPTATRSHAPSKPGKVPPRTEPRSAKQEPATSEPAKPKPPSLQTKRSSQTRSRSR